MKGIKRICAIAAAFAMAANTVCITATENAVNIADFQIKDGVISVTVMNNTNADTIMTLVLKKTDGDIAEKDRFYAVLDNLTEAQKTASFEISIPDDRGGIRGSGSYTLKIQNQAKDSAEKSFEYADGLDVSAFVALLKAKDSEITDAAKAYETLLPVIENSANRGELSTIGLNYEQFSSKNEAVRQNTMNVLHNSGIQDLTKDTLPDAFLGAFGLAVFNCGEKTEGIEILSPEYDGKAPDEEIMKNAISIMEESYSDVNKFNQGFKTAYGLETVNLATMNSIDLVLETFASETGECGTLINQIKGIDDVLKKRSAYEYIILRLVENKVTNVSGLNGILDAAYKAATDGSGGSGSSGGSGGGGGSLGSASNSVGANYGSVTSPAGASTPDKKAETTDIFVDLKSNHWSAPAVLWLKNRGVVSGNENGEFEPDRAVTREEFTKMLAVVCKLAVGDGKTAFADVESSEWYARYISAAVNAGIVNGVSENSFGIGQKITRQDMSVMTKRAADTIRLLIQGLVFGLATVMQTCILTI